MKKIDLGQTINTLANIGVVAGILFLAVELQQNQAVGQAQNRNEITREFLQLNQLEISGDITNVILRRLNDESLSQADRWRLSKWADSWLRVFENLHYQNRIGLFDDDEIEGHVTGIKLALNSSGFVRDYFCESRALFSPRFVADVESWLTDPCP